jgi:hypothetical protein
LILNSVVEVELVWMLPARWLLASLAHPSSSYRNQLASPSGESEAHLGKLSTQVQLWLKFLQLSQQALPWASLAQLGR